MLRDGPREDDMADHPEDRHKLSGRGPAPDNTSMDSASMGSVEHSATRRQQPPERRGNGHAAKPDISETIRSNIVPRLLELTQAHDISTNTVPPRLIAAVADAAVAGENAVVESHLFAHIRHGARLADALVDVIGAAAQTLGEGWENDTRDFMDVTVGLGTLQQVISAVTAQHVAAPLPDRTLLLGAAPGEDHTLGLALVDHFFRQARWSVEFMPYADRDALLDAISGEHFAVFGLSVASDLFTEEAAKIISDARRLSRNKSVKIMVGGPLCAHAPKLVDGLGADAVVADGRIAVRQANSWLPKGAGDHLHG